jgi:hypothetical protein
LEFTDGVRVYPETSTVFNKIHKKRRNIPNGLTSGVAASVAAHRAALFPLKPIIHPKTSGYAFAFPGRSQSFSGLSVFARVRQPTPDDSEVE